MGKGGVIHRRLIAQNDAAGRRFAATLVGDRVFTTYLSGADPVQVRAMWKCPPRALWQIGGGLLAVSPLTDDPAVEPQETEVFKDQSVLLAIRNHETPEATRDWLAWHEQLGATAALIFNRESGEESANYVQELGRHLLNSSLVVMVVDASEPMSNPNLGGTERPGTDEFSPPDLWHAPFSETILLETLRRRFLSEAGAVAFLDISDLAINSEASVFDQASEQNGKFVPLKGVEAYPWRLRGGAPAPHHDHIYRSKLNSRVITRWCVAPKWMDQLTMWRVIRIGGTDAARIAPVPFVRAMGVVHPGAPVKELVKKPTLSVDESLSARLEDGFGVAAIRGNRKVREIPKGGSDVTVVSVMKNEGPYILDWIAHCRVVGVDQFLVYTNDCEDGTDHLLDLVGNAAGITHRENPYRKRGGVPQYAAFRAAENEEIVQSSSWLLTLDVDEYINIHSGDGTFGDIFAMHPDANVISMPWRLFGSSDRIDFSDTPVTEQFETCAERYSPRPHWAWGFKTLYRNAGMFRRLGVHRPKGLRPATVSEINWIDGSGRPFPPSLWKGGWRMTADCWGYDMVTVNHYAVRSAESFLVKRERGRVNHVKRDQGLAYWFRMNHNISRDTSIHRYADEVAVEKARLLALPGVAECHKASVEWHRTRIANLRSQAGYAEIFEQITGERMKRLTRMQQHFGSNVFLTGPEVIPDDVVDRPNEDSWVFTIPVALRKE